jgi:hypothetical protein
MTVLSVPELKTALPVPPQGVTDDWLLSLLNAAESEMTNRYGPASGPIVEQHLGGLRVISLFRPANGVGGISSIVEQSSGADVALATDDWVLHQDYMHLFRQCFGSHPSDRFAGEVQVTFTPLDDSDERKRIQVLLVKQDLAYNGYASVTTQSESRAAIANYQLERAAILASYSLTSEKYH